MGNIAHCQAPPDTGATAIRETGNDTVCSDDCSSRITGEWRYIPRNVEAALERYLASPHSVVLVRGHRRIGRTTTVDRVLRRLGPKYELVNARLNEEEFRKALVEQLNPTLLGTSQATMIQTTKRIIMDHVKDGKHLVLDEIQNMSMDMQVSLQETLDGIVFDVMLHEDLGENKTVSSAFCCSVQLVTEIRR